MKNLPSLKTPTALLLEIATAPANTLRVYGENRAEDALLLVAFGFVRPVGDQYGPNPSGDITRVVTVQATATGLDLFRRIASLN